KSLIGSGTSSTGSLYSDCTRGLVRNLDWATGFADDPNDHGPVLYKVFPFEIKASEMQAVRAALDAGKPAVVVHLAEGTTPSTRREFKMLQKQELLRQGMVIIHGTALTADDFKAMAAAGVSLVWSPRSNMELYGATTKVMDAK